mgnify:CR=1 FL=1
MFLKPSKMPLSPIIFIIALLIVTNCSVQAKNIIPDSLDIIVKISRINETLNVIEELMKGGAEGIVLGCTEIPLIIQQKDVRVPLFDTTEIHAKAAVDFALQDV